MKVLVTGSTGFIGRNLCFKLEDLGHEVTRLTSQDVDISVCGFINKLPAVHHVFHLAGRTFVPDSWNFPVDFQRTNVLGTNNILEYCRSTGAQLTYVSAYLYGIPDRLPVSEYCVPKPNNPYALSKYLAEQLCEFYTAYHDVNVTVLRPFNIFGNGQKGHFLIPEIVSQIRGGREIHLQDLSPRRDYLYIDDLIDALVKTLKHRVGYRLYNIGYGSSLSVAEIVDAIQFVAGTSLPVFSERKSRKNEIPDVFADITKARTELGWLPQHTFRDGVIRMISLDKVGNDR